MILDHRRSRIAFLQPPIPRTKPQISIEQDWNVIPDTGRKKGTFSSFFESAKTKIYNIYKSYPREPATFTSNTPIWLLGEHYDQQESNKNPQLQLFLDHFASITLFTYRSHFPPFYNTELTTDMGWGCMIRTGQMMLARALTVNFLGNNWRFTQQENMLLLSIVHWFKDEQNPKAPYSIHNIMRLASIYNIQPGEWFGPSMISNLLKIIVRVHSPGQITMYVSKNLVVYRDAVCRLCCSPDTSPLSPSTIPHRKNRNMKQRLNNWNKPLPSPSPDLTTPMVADLLLTPLVNNAKLQRDVKSSSQPNVKINDNNCDDSDDNGGKNNNFDKNDEYLHHDDENENATNSQTQLSTPSTPIIHGENHNDDNDNNNKNDNHGGENKEKNRNINNFKDDNNNNDDNENKSTGSNNNDNNNNDNDNENGDNDKNKVDIIDDNSPNNSEDKTTNSTPTTPSSTSKSEINNSGGSTEKFRPVIIMVPVRLGPNTEINEYYIHQVKILLSFSQSIGMIGGKPNSSFYFVGFQDDDLIYLDPHIVFKYNEDPTEQSFGEENVCRTPQKLPIRLLDPSMAFGFLCKNQNDFNDFCNNVKKLEAENKSPIFTVSDVFPPSDEKFFRDRKKEKEISKLMNTLLYSSVSL